MYCTGVLALLVLFVSSARSFSWDIVVGGDTRLEFYYNGTLTHTEDIPSTHLIYSLTYDPVNYRVLFVDYDLPNTTTIFSFDISTKKIQPLVIRTTNDYVRVVYDVVTQALYCKERRSIYSFSLDPTSSKKDLNLLLSMDHYCYDLAVDSCGGYIYWITDYEIERARLDGSEREVLVDSQIYRRRNLVIDQQAQKMYWMEKIYSDDNQMSIESANFNGKNRTTFYTVRDASYSISLAISKDFIYLQNYQQKEIWQLPKKPELARKLYSMSGSLYEYGHHIAANYTIKDQSQDIKSCPGLQGLIPYNSSESAVSICQIYCFQGECSVSAKGQPTCSCETGYSGERCEVNACHQYCLNGGVCSLNEEDEPVCQCTADYGGGRCEISAHKDTRYDAVNTGEGKVSACYQFCLNNGVCSLNEANEPVCHCTAGYEGERCEVSVNKDFVFQAACSVSTEGQPTVTVTLGKGVK